jgi:hypothetical protein
MWTRSWMRVRPYLLWQFWFFTFLRNKGAVHTHCYRSEAWRQNVYCMCRLTAVNQTTPVLDCILMQFSPFRTIALVSLRFHLTFYLHPQPRLELHKQILKRYMIHRRRAYLKLSIAAADLKRPLTSDTVSWIEQMENIGVNIYVYIGVCVCVCYVLDPTIRTHVVTCLVSLLRRKEHWRPCHNTRVTY